MTTHVGLIRSIHGIDYNYHNIPNIVTIYPSYIHNDESTVILSSLQENLNQQNIINCITNELQNTIQSNFKIDVKLQSYSINQISTTKGIFPTKHSSLFTCLINIGKSGPITLKNNKTNDKYTFTIDNGMMVLIQDNSNHFTHNIQMDTSTSSSFLNIENVENDDKINKRFILTFHFI